MSNNDLISRDYVSNKICDLYSDGEKANKKDRTINEVMDIIDNAPTVFDRYDEGFRDGYAQCINDKEERKENNRLFRKGGAE